MNPQEHNMAVLGQIVKLIPSGYVNRLNQNLLIFPKVIYVVFRTRSILKKINMWDITF